MPPLYVHLIANYLTNRTISVSSGGGTATKTLTLSTPQGAVLSPVLWNLFIDTLLLDIEKTFPDVRISAWADDVILAFNYRYINPQIAKNKLHDISKTLKQWSDRNKATFIYPQQIRSLSHQKLIQPYQPLDLRHPHWPN